MYTSVHSHSTTHSDSRRIARDLSGHHDKYIHTPLVDVTIICHLTGKVLPICENMVRTEVGYAREGTEADSLFRGGYTLLEVPAWGKSGESTGTSCQQQRVSMYDVRLA